MWEVIGLRYQDEIDNLMRFFGNLHPGDTFYRPMQYVLEHLYHIADISIQEMAKESFVSTATISRMCRELGYQNFPDFKLHTYIAYQQAVEQEDSNSAFRIPREDAASMDAAMVLNYLDLCRSGLDFSENFVRGEYFEQHLAILRRADTVLVFSTAYVDIVPLQRKLVLARKKCAMLFGTVAEITAQSPPLLKNDENVCCLFFLHTREEYDAFKPFIEFLREKGFSAIMLRPMSIHAGIDYPLLDRAISFPDVGSLSDETFFSNYIACLSIAL